MTVYFVYRCHYDARSEKHVRRFDDPTVLDWFRNRWAGDLTPGMDVYGFPSLGEAVGEHGIPVPESDEQLEAILDEHLYVEGEIELAPHCLQVLTDDDELQMAYFFFDDVFLAEHVDRAAFLLRDDWRLPHEASGPGFAPHEHGRPVLDELADDQGTVWVALLAYYDSANLDDLEGPRRIDGVRLPELPRWLATRELDSEAWPFELRLLRAQLFAGETAGVESELVAAIRNDPADLAAWDVYGDWLAERGRPPAGVEVLEQALRGCIPVPVAPMTNSLNLEGFGRGSPADARAELQAEIEGMTYRREFEPAKSALQVNEHLAQLCLHTDRWGEQDLYHQWILFDDVWAAAHPALANGILRFAARWDVLSD